MAQDATATGMYRFCACPLLFILPSIMTSKWLACTAIKPEMYPDIPAIKNVIRIVRGDSN